MAHNQFVHLRVRTGFSLLEGAVRHSELARACAAQRMPAVAVTDHANLFGAMQFCDAMRKEGVQPIVGALMPIVEETARARARTHATSAPLLALLVTSDKGYANLLKLMSRAYLCSEDHQAGEIALCDLKGCNEGLICLSGGAQGPIGRAFNAGRADEGRAIFKTLKELFGDRFYQEITRIGFAEEAACEEALVKLALDENVPLVATNDVHFIEADFFKAHDALLCIAQGRKLADDERRKSSPDYRFKSAAEMVRLFADLPEAIANTLVIARRCAFATPSRDPILPTFADDEEAEMRRQAAQGLERRLEAHVLAPGMDAQAREDAARPYRERLAYELDIIAQMKFPGYFLIVSDFIKWAKGQNIPVGPGRGSGAGSVVAWSLQITDLDPLRFGLLFERFLNPERISMPDFDIDFCEERRGEVIAYVRDRYGAEKVAQIITFGTLQARAALRDVGRVMGLPFTLVDRICKLVPNNPANPVTLAKALELEPRLVDEMEANENIASMVETAMKLEGLPRNASTHAAGVVIGDRPLEQLVPLYRDPRALMQSSQFNMKDVEKAGLVKFDFLGLSTLTLLTIAERMIRESGTDLDLATLELDDKPSYDLLTRAETTGVFQLESGGMRDALRKLKPDVFEDIIAMVSLYRPGPMDNIPRYTNVKHGIEQPEYMHPMLEPILAETNGVIIYQEQVMEIAKQLAGYTLGGADLLRRAMGKKIKKEMDDQRENFVKGCIANAIDEDMAHLIFDAVAKFASYGFNKSHAAAYALLAYQTAYLKANFPCEFYAAAMTIEIDSQDKLASFRQEMNRRGVPCYPPDVNMSEPRFVVEQGKDGKGVRFALAAIKGVGAGAMEALLEARRTGGPFTDLFDLTDRVGPRYLNKRILEALVKAGALDSIAPNRARLFAAIDPAMRYAQACAAEAESSQESLFGSGAAAKPRKPLLPECEDWPSLERLGHELDAVGFYMSAHPLDGFRSALARARVLQSADLAGHLADFSGRGRVTLAGVVLGRQERLSERGRWAFVQMSDATGSFEVTVYSDVLATARVLLDSREPLLVEVDARAEDGNLRLIAQRFEPLSTRIEKDKHGLVEIRVRDVDTLARLKPSLGETGGFRVRLIVRTRAGEDVVLALPEDYLLGYARKGDVERMEGIISLTEISARH